MRLAGRIALVTGGSSGIVKAVIWALAREGAKIAFVYQSDSEAAERLIADLELDQHEAVAIPCDVRQTAACEEVVEKVLQRWEKIDILVNDAGMIHDTLPAATSEEKWTDVVNTNLNRVYNFCQAVTRPMMSARYGRIVNMSGVSANPGESGCGAGKNGIEGFTCRLAGDLAKHGITVNAVAAGFIETGTTADVRNAAGDQLKKRIPVGRLGRPKDVGNAVLFLVSDESSYITGHVLAVDGGLTLGGF